jgi:hypothetical protein
VPEPVSHPTHNSQAASRGVSLLLLPPASVVALVPAWAVLCGALAALGGAWTAHDGRWSFQTALDPQAWIALVLVVFIVQVLWSTGQTLLIESSRRYRSRDTALAPPPQSGPKRRLPRLPYTTPWSPLGRLGRRWQTLSLTESARWTFVLVPLLVIILSAVIGWQMAILSLAATALSLIEWRVARQERASSALQAGTLVGLGWLAGHTVFAPLTWTSLTIACCCAIAYQGALELDREEPSPGKTESPAGNRRLPWALSLLYGGQGAALVLLVVLGHPLAATLSGLLLAPQWLLLPLLATRPCRSYIRQAIPFVTAAMLVAAGAMSA